MSLLTSFLQLFKWNTSDENDLEQQFDIDKAMNDNWDKLDEAIEDLDTNKVDKVDGKGLSTNDFTNEYKEKLDSLKNYDDTEITQEIEDIQEEQAKQNEDIEDLKQNDAKQDDLIQKLKDNCINVTTEEATSLQVIDASTLPAKLDVRGNHSQETREGYNELKITEGNQTYYGVTMTVNNDGSVKFNGTATATTGGFLLTGNTNYSVDDFPYGEQLTFSCEGLVEGLELAIAEADSSGAWLRNIVVLNSTNPKQQITPTKGENAVYIRVAYTVTNGKTFNNIITYPMFYKGTENKSFEQYGASPSIDYPSTVHDVGDNVNIFDKDNVNKILATPSNLTMIASKSGGASFYLEIKPNTNYSISRKIVGSRFLAATSVEIPTVGVSLTQNVPNNNGDEINITTGENDNYLLVYYLYNNSENEEEILSSIKIEEGTEATTYSPYGQGSVEVKKINSNIMPILELGSYWKYTEKGIQNIEGNSGHTITSFNLKKGQTIKVGFKLFSKPTVSTSFTGYIDGAENTNLNLTNINNFNLNQVYTRTYTATKDCKFGYVMWGNSNTSIFEFQLWANLENAEDYQQYEEQSYILDIQKPMLNGDCFDFKNNKEVHIWKENTLNGTENWQQSSIYNDIYYLQDNNMSSDISKGNLICDQFFFGGIVTSTDDMENNKCYRYQTGTILSNNIYVKNSNFKSVTDFKAALAEKNMTLYYIAKYATQLDLTKQQKEVLNQLAELPIFKGTNNIITAESLALMQMQYIADTETYIDNRIDEKLANINQQILEIAGGN